MPRFGESQYDRAGEAGARTLDEDAAERARLQIARRQAQHDQLENARLSFEEAEFQRKTAEAVALAKRKADLHSRLSTSLPLLLGMDYTDEDFDKDYYRFGSKHAADILDDPAAKQIYEKLGEQRASYKRQQDEIEARVSAAQEATANRKQMADEARQGREALLKLNQDYRDQQRQDHEDFKKSMTDREEEFKKDTAKTLAETKAQAKSAIGNQKHQNDFEKAYSDYDGHLKTLQDSQMSAQTPVSLKFLTDKNVARAKMQTAADRIKQSGDPDAAQDIADKLKAADLEEHAAIEAKLNGGDVPTNAFAKQMLMNEANAVKKRLGYWQINNEGHAVDENGAVITDPQKLTSAPPWAQPEDKKDTATSGVGDSFDDAAPAEAGPASAPVPSAAANPANTPAPVGSATDAADPSAEHKAALEWARANPDHPAAKKILDTAAAALKE